MISKTVYALYFPEVRPVVDELWNGHHHEWYERAYTKHQDGMHVEFLDTWREWSGVSLGEGFPHAYPTANGASEAIKDLMLPPGKLHVFEGEYEGYAAIAKARRMKVHVHSRTGLLQLDRFGPKDMFWISNPSAIDGNVWEALPSFLEYLQERRPKVRVIIDATYVGATVRPVTFEPSRHPNVSAVIFSLSKPMGVYYHRVGGCFSRTPIDTLWGNLWFKNLFSLQLGTALMRRFDRTALPTLYGPIRDRVMEKLRRDGKLDANVLASDVTLLAHSETGPEALRRAPGVHRYCLTEAIDRHIRGEYE